MEDREKETESVVTGGGSQKEAASQMSPKDLAVVRSAALKWRAASIRQRDVDETRTIDSLANELGDTLSFWKTIVNEKKEQESGRHAVIPSTRGIIDFFMTKSARGSFKKCFCSVSDGSLTAHKGSVEDAQGVPYGIENAIVDEVGSTRFRGHSFVLRLLCSDKKTRLFLSFASEEEKDAWKKVIVYHTLPRDRLHPYFQLSRHKVEEMIVEEKTPFSLSPFDESSGAAETFDPSASAGKSSKTIVKDLKKERKEKDLLAKNDAKDGIVTDDFKGWNVEFQHLREKEEAKSTSAEVDQGKKYLSLQKKFLDFTVRACKEVAIDSSLPQMHQSLYWESESDGGDLFDSDFGIRVVKYNGVTLRIVEGDPLLKSSDDVEMTELAYKIAKHNLRGHEFYEEHGEPRVCPTLHCLVDFYGYRVLAEADIPISSQIDPETGLNKEPLIYGLSTRQVGYRTEPRRILRDCAKKMGLKEHYVFFEEEKPVKIHASIELQVLMGTDERMYLRNAARTCPPDASYRIRDENAVHSRLLRKELIAAYGLELSPDAFRNVGGKASDKEECDLDVRRASLFLHDNVIPSFVAMIDKGTRLFNRCVGFLDGDHLCREMHNHGINIRYLGKIAELTALPHIRSVCESEMCARVCKHLLFRLFREIISARKQDWAHEYDFAGGEMPQWMPDLREKMEVELKVAATDFFNLILGCSVESVHYWEDVLKVEVKNRFKYTIIPKDIYPVGLFVAMQRQCGCTFRCEMINFDVPTPIDVGLFSSFVPRVAVLDNPSLFVNVIIRNVPEMLQDKKFLEAIQAIDLEWAAKRQFSPEPSSIGDLENLLYASFALNGESFFEGAFLLAKATLSIAKKLHFGFHMVTVLAYLVIIRALRHMGTTGREAEIQEYFEEAVNLVQYIHGYEHPVIIELKREMAEIAIQESRWKDAVILFESIVEIAQQTMGRAHEETLNSIEDLASVFVDIGKEQLLREKKSTVGMISGHDGPIIEETTDRDYGKEGIIMLRKVLQRRPTNTDGAADSHEALANALGIRGQHEAALEEMLLCLKIRVDILGMESPLVFATLKRTVQLAELAKRFDKALDLRLQILSELRRQLKVIERSLYGDPQEIDSIRSSTMEDGDVDELMMDEEAEEQHALDQHHHREESESALAQEEIDRREADIQRKKEAEEGLREAIRSEIKVILRLGLSALPMNLRAVVNAALTFQEGRPIHHNVVREVIHLLWNDSPITILHNMIEDAAQDTKIDAPSYQQLASLYHLVSDEQMIVREEVTVPSVSFPWDNDDPDGDADADVEGDFGDSVGPSNGGDPDRYEDESDVSFGHDMDSSVEHRRRKDEATVMRASKEMKHDHHPPAGEEEFKSRKTSRHPT
eukprot:TRINITY_DN45499_c0_g3_i1.p1 TRINITY_DN45499_c0_g3~~TRINITY_DN45499_c0_g3_i1.p1  ORF type:complete len:1401 (+),score=432.64 TRINITY_DN45499_c0_g3_i1:96-4205(+)